MGMGDAVADALREDRAAGAESAAVRARVEASNSKNEAQRQTRRADGLSHEAKMWERHAKHLEEVLAQRNAMASAGLIVIDAMIKTMETLAPDQRERFRDHVAQLARARMQKLDADMVNGPTHVSIARTFGADPQNKVLGIV
jgi:hypothetical protein